MTHEAGAVTVHVYSPPLRAIGYYEIVGGLLQRTPGPPDEPSPESPRLLAAVTARDVGQLVQLDQDAAPAGAGQLGEHDPGQRGTAVAQPAVH